MWSSATGAKHTKNYSGQNDVSHWWAVCNSCTICAVVNNLVLRLGKSMGAWDYRYKIVWVRRNFKQTTTFELQASLWFILNGDWCIDDWCNVSHMICWIGAASPHSLAHYLWIWRRVELYVTGQDGTRNIFLYILMSPKITAINSQQQVYCLGECQIC